MLVKLPVLAKLLILVLLLIGCAAIGRRLEAPRINIVHLKLLEIRPFESVFQLDLRLMNTNDVPLVVKGLECELELNGRKFASGVSRVEKRIGVYETDVVPIQVYTSVIDMVKSVLTLPNNEVLSYRIRGSVRLGGGAIPSVIPFAAEGKVALQRPTQAD